MSLRIFATIVILFGLSPLVAAEDALVYSASNLPDEYRGKPKPSKPVPLEMLRRKPMAEHRVGAGDVLGIMIESLMGERCQTWPERPGICDGYPIFVKDDCTIKLPHISPIEVDGLTLLQVEKTIRIAYSVKTRILKAGNERIAVKLLQPRKCHIIVMRADGDHPSASKNETVYPLELPVGESDVLHALAKSGGLPGADGKNELLIYKRATQKKSMQKKNEPENDNAASAADEPGTVVHIPLRFREDPSPPFRDEDVVLDNGDIVCIERRVPETFFTSGLLGSDRYPLPRDLDIDVIQAVVYVKPPPFRGFFTGNLPVDNESRVDYLTSDYRLSILRTTSSGRQLVIRIDTENALDPNSKQRLIILPDDVVDVQKRSWLNRLGLAPRVDLRNPLVRRTVR